MKPIYVEKKELGKYAVAPYNFVSFPEKAQIKYHDISELPKHDCFKDNNGNNLLSGYINYELRAETPIMVSSGTLEDKQAKCFVNPSGEYAIPGNTIRGLIKSNAHILSFSSVVGSKDSNDKYVDSNIEDSRFLFRDVAGNNSLNIKYKSILNIDVVKRIAKNLKAGYISKKEGKYYIEPAVELMEGKSYFRIDEIELRKIVDNDISNINYMYGESLISREEELRELNKLITKSRINRIRDFESSKKLANILSSNENKKYIPYQTAISFEYDKSKGKVTKIGEKGAYKNEGYILSGGSIRGKRSHYIIPASMPNIDSINIGYDEIEYYIDDLIMTKKAKKTAMGAEINSNYEFWALPKSNEKKPVFYINVGEVLHFGFTPYLRMFYSKTVLDGIPKGYRDIEGISYVDGMFGFSNRKIKNQKEKISYKSRVSFEDAVVVGETEIDQESSIRILLAEPKPTSYNLYLAQNKDADKKTLKIYEDNFKLRGIKQYWLKSYVEQPIVESEAMSFNINPLKVGTSFKGKIYFNNLYEDELGLLLWSLKLKEGCYQNIGLAKPYGFGRIEIEKISLSIEDINKKYESFSFDYTKDENPDKYISTFKETFSKDKLNGRNIDDEKTIKELMLIKSKVVNIDEANSYRYMELKLNEFKDKKVLPEILDYCDIKSRGTSNISQTQSIPNKTNKTNNKVHSNGYNKALYNNSLAEQLKKWQKNN